MQVNKKRLVVLVAICAVISAILIRIFLGGAGRSESTALQLDVESGVTSQTFAYEQDILLADGQNVHAVNTAGQAMWAIPIANTNPFLDIAGKYLLIGEQSGKSFSVYSGSTELRVCRIENNLISAKVNPGGYVVLLCEESGYKGMAVVQNPKGNEIFRWHSGEGYVIDAALSDDSRYLAVSQLMTDREKAYSRIVFFDIAKNEQIAMTEREDSIVARIQFGGGGWTAVSDTEVLGFRKSGNLKFAVSFQGRKVTDFDISTPNNLVFAFVNSRNNTVLEMYDKNGKLRGSYEATDELKNLNVKGEVILCSQMRNLIYLDPSGTVRRTLSVPHDIKTVQLFGDRRHALVMGGSTANIIQIR